MKYSKKRCGAELILELEKGYDIQRISDWAGALDSGYEDLEDDGLREILREIGAMSSDPQFEYTEDQLLAIAIKLIKE